MIGSISTASLLELFLKALEMDWLDHWRTSMGIKHCYTRPFLETHLCKKKSFSFIVLYREPYLYDPLVVSVLNVVKLRTKEMDLCLINTASEPVRVYIFILFTL